MKEVRQNQLLTIGSIWRDEDPRFDKCLLRVLCVDYKLDLVYCDLLNTNRDLVGPFKITRFNNMNHGFKFVRNSE